MSTARKSKSSRILWCRYGVQVRWVKQGKGMPELYNMEDEGDFDSLALRHLPEPGGSVWEELLAAYKAANQR